MTAEFAVQPTTLQLLAEPLKPLKRLQNNQLQYGWRPIGSWEGRRRRVTWIRDHAHDDDGAAIQHLICRYALWGVRRSELAAETGYSERQIQTWLSGGSRRGSYGTAVLQRLAALGIGPGRGCRNDHRSVQRRRRLDQIVAAQAALMEAVVEGRATEQTMADIRLLLAGREPVRLP